VILCLSCFSLSPAGSLFCQGCGRSFGARLCGSKKRHRNHPAAQFCSQCGSDNLTDPTLYLPFGCVTWILSWALVFLIARWLWPHLRAAAGWAFNNIAGLICCLLNYAIYWSVLLLMIYLFLTLIPGEAGKHLRQVFSQVLRLIVRLTAYTIKAVFSLLRAIVGSARSLKS
jgi:hypothetical protein